MELLIGGEFPLTHLLLVNSKKDILLDTLLDIPPTDMYPFSVFGSKDTKRICPEVEGYKN